MLRIAHISDLHIRDSQMDNDVKSLLQRLAEMVGNTVGVEIEAGGHDEHKLVALQNILRGLKPDVFGDTAVGLFMMGNQQVPGVSDFLYSAMLEQARGLGASYLNVGPSPSSGHFSFKLKWGGEPKVPPYYFVQWGRGRLARRFHTSWGPRILRLRTSH